MFTLPDTDTDFTFTDTGTDTDTMGFKPNCIGVGLGLGVGVGQCEHTIMDTRETIQKLVLNQLFGIKNFYDFSVCFYGV